MNKLSLKNIYHSIGIIFWLIYTYALYNIFHLEIIPWVFYFIQFSGPCFIYLISLLHPQKQKLDFLLYLVFTLAYFAISYFVVDSSESVKTISKFLLIPIITSIHYVLYNNNKSSNNKFKWIETTLLICSFLNCILSIFIQSNMFLLILEILLVLSITGIKIYSIILFYNFSKTHNP